MGEIVTCDFCGERMPLEDSYGYDGYTLCYDCCCKYEMEKEMEKEKDELIDDYLVLFEMEEYEEYEENE